MSNMDVNTETPDTDISVINVPNDTSPTLSTSDAARMLRAARKPKEQSLGDFNQAARDKMAADAIAREPTEIPESTAQAGDAAPPQEAPGEQTEAAEPAPEEPPIAPPRSWTKAEKERFATLPRETQEYLAERETERDREVRRSQNETAEKLKGLTA